MVLDYWSPSPFEVGDPKRNMVVPQVDPPPHFGGRKVVLNFPLEDFKALGFLDLKNLFDRMSRIQRIQVSLFRRLGLLAR